MPARSFLTQQIVSNVTYLHPGSNPTVLTARDPKTQGARIVVLRTTAPQEILYTQAGSAQVDFEALLSQTEDALHEKLTHLPVENLITAVDNARLQRENQALLDEINRARGPMNLVLPTERKKKIPSVVLAATPPTSETPVVSRVAEPAPAKSLTPHLPRSKASKSTLRTSVVTSPAQAPDDDTIVSPKTITVTNVKAHTNPPAKWGDGSDAGDIAAWIRSISGEEKLEESTVLTPPLTPPLMSKRLPRSRKFEGR